MTIQQQRNKLLLERLLEMNLDEDWAETVTDVLAVGIEEVAENDGFGTERQCSPCGDGRNGNFSIDFVEGIDK